MSNKLVLAIYAAVFAATIWSYDLYKDSTIAVAIAAAVVTVGGLIAWLVSARGKHNDQD